MSFVIDAQILNIPKAELHVHIEGTVTPDMARRKAGENNIRLDPAIFSADGARYQWRDFYHLVTDVYSEMARAIRTRQDYEDITYDYLTRCAAEGSIYEELIIWCSQGDAVGLSYADMVEGMAAAIDRAETNTGIIARLNTALVRHQPFENVRREAETIAAYPHPYIVGLDLAGGECSGDIPQYQPLFDLIFARFGRPLGMRLHAGEAAGPENIRAALALHPAPLRIGHGVRCIEDEALVQELVARKVVLEICPTSNVLAGIYNSYANHPLRRLQDAGVRICLNADDPGLFGCSLAGEYQVARDHFGFSDHELMQSTRTALAAAFCDDLTRQTLLSQRAFVPGLRDP
ncbi:MAG: adenosine deaminase [Alphaproteobacteria bacterium]|nr:adenosine deaminase [Alphaproteobacteria bacterium]